MEFLNMPLLKSIGLKAFTYGEMVFYPSYKNRLSFKFLRSDTRLSFGFGMAVPLNEMISILVYYNAINFNSAPKGDIERKGFLNINIGFF